MRYVGSIMFHSFAGGVGTCRNSRSLVSTFLQFTLTMTTQHFRVPFCTRPGLAVCWQRCLTAAAMHCDQEHS